MTQSLQLYVLSLTDSCGQPKAIPFLWDGSGDEEAAVRQVIEEKGADVLGDDEKESVLENLPRLIRVMESCVSGPWAFQEVPVVHAPNTVPVVAIPFRLAEKCPEVEAKRPVTGTLHLYLGHDVGIHFDGFEASDSIAPDAETMALEVWNSGLRILAWPDRTDEEPTIIEMEGARTQAK
jgi:hypothetical protein